MSLHKRYETVQSAKESDYIPPTRVTSYDQAIKHLEKVYGICSTPSLNSHSAVII